MNGTATGAQLDGHESPRARVLHVIVPEPPGEVGGADLHIADLASEQLGAGSFEPLVLEAGSADYAARLARAGIPHLAGSAGGGGRVALIRRLRELPETGRIALLHSHGYDANYLTYCLRHLYRSSWGQLPTVMTCHGWIEASIGHKLKTHADFLTYRTAQSLILCSEDQRARVSSLRRRPQTFYVPNGVPVPAALTPPDVGRPQLLERLRLDGSPFLVAAVGRLSPEKRLDVFLTVCRRIADVRDDVHFLVVGEGGQRAKLERLATQLGLRRLLTFTGLVTDMEVVYSGIALLVHTSDAETTPRVLLEAMCRRVPVVATRVGGVTSIVSGGVGVLVEPGDVTAIADASLQLLDRERVRRAMGTAGRERVAREFSSATMRERVEAVYWATLDRKRAGQARDAPSRPFPGRSACPTDGAWRAIGRCVASRA